MEGNDSQPAQIRAPRRPLARLLRGQRGPGRHAAVAPRDGITGGLVIATGGPVLGGITVELLRAVGDRRRQLSDRRREVPLWPVLSRRSMSVRPATRSSKHLGATLGTGRDWRRRLLFHHAPLALASVVVFVLFMGLSPFANIGHGDTSFGFELSSLQPGDDSYVSRVTIATGYVAVGLLVLTLLIGPVNLLLRRRNPVSNYLRRDVGTWTAIFSVVHVIVSFQTLGGGVFTFVQFFVVDGRPLISNSGLGNWTGLAALVVVVSLLAISTTRSVRELKPERWKNLQRLNYTLFALVVVHAIFYGPLLRITSPFTLVLVFAVVMVFMGQAVGIWLYRQRSSARTAIGQGEQHSSGKDGTRTRPQDHRAQPSASAGNEVV